MDNNSKYIPEFRAAEKLVYDEKYIITNKHTNILFLGSCRMIVMYMYLKRVIENDNYLKHAQYGYSVATVYHPILNNSINSPPSKTLHDTFETADIIICETIKHSGYLNTDKNTDENIYSTFKLRPNCRIIQLPNINVNMFMNDLSISYPNKTVSELIDLRTENINELLHYLRNFEYSQTAQFIEYNIYTARLFATEYHPMPIIFQVFVKEFVKKIWDIDIDINWISDINISQFLGKTDLSDLDYTTGIATSVLNY